MKKEKGITLVALAITIIVMLILLGVTVTGAINGGLIGTSQEAKYKTEISQIKEALEEEIINRKALKESVEDITIEDLEISDKLKEKFNNKLVIYAKSKDILYNPETVTKAEEMAWLEDMEIYPTTLYFTISGATITGFSEKGYEAINKGVLSFIIPTKTKDGTIITTIGASAFNANTEGKEKCANVKSIIIPESVTTIGGWAFAYCTELKNVEVLGKGNFYWAFKGCTNLETITFNQDEGISFSGGAFAECKNLKQIRIPASVTWFGDYLFSGCTSLQYIEIPENSKLTSIQGWGALWSLNSSVHIHLPMNMVNEGSTWQTRCSFKGKIYVPITREEYPAHWEGTQLTLTNTNVIFKDDEGWHSAEECPNKIQ
ncbi:MAG: leucine-rich repeat domain-containing protein [Clostridia bacterium]